ncbi:M56 family metallopeptidase [Chitinophaga sp. 22321]|uniref:M48 family metalloprotease n=1 Tax=Chitinophaga hostae TaxID=2831022 RepID=A0ABS5IWR0_9BACT|nr:M56 family metallopeptidase [Chitinophaga hostae]MBS0027389.1 M48 family metalloprotease [Chitinophaga hostae]
MNLLPITGDLVRALGWTILHSMWQAFLIYACLRIVLKLWPQAGARIKYNLSFVSLTGIFTWFLATFYMHIQRLQEARSTILALHGTISLQDPVSLPAVYPSQDPLIWLFPNLELCFPLLVTLYIAGMTGMTVKLFSDLFQLHQIRTTRIEPMGAAWDKHLHKLAAQLQIPRKVKLLISRHVQVPVMLGFLKPLILLPVAMVNNLTEEQLEAVLLHELAHIKRNDYLLNIFQSIVETILFFNPFVWLISKTIRIEREHCCDDLVIASTVQPLQYAHALVALEQYRLTAHRLTMAAADSKQHLFHRIKRIMEMKTNHLNYSQKFLAVLIIATSLISIAWLNPAKGKSNETKEQQVTEKHLKDSVSPKKADDGNNAVELPQAANSQFKRALDEIIVDTVEPAPPVPPAPDPAAAPGPAPLPGPATTPGAIGPLNNDLSGIGEINDETSYRFHKISDSSANVYSHVKVKTNTNVNNKMSFSYNYNYSKDTNITKEEIRKQIREAQKSIQLAMKQLQEVDMKKVQADIQAATKNINWKDVSEEVRKAQAESAAALKNVDWDQISKAQAEAAAALKNIDFATLNKNLAMAYQSLDMKDLSNKIRKEVATSLQSANMSKEENSRRLADIRKQRAEALEDAARAREEAGKTREAAKKDMAYKREEIAERREKADKDRREANEKREENDIYQEMLRRMVADNLLDTQKDYSVEKNDNGLFINGVKQPDNIVAKYRKYLKAKQVHIKGSSTTYHVGIEN